MNAINQALGITDHFIEEIKRILVGIYFLREIKCDLRRTSNDPSFSWFKKSNYQFTEGDWTLVAEACKLLQINASQFAEILMQYGEICSQSELLELLKHYCNELYFTLLESIFNEINQISKQSCNHKHKYHTFLQFVFVPGITTQHEPIQIQPTNHFDFIQFCIISSFSNTTVKYPILRYFLMIKHITYVSNSPRQNKQKKTHNQA